MRKFRRSNHLPTIQAKQQIYSSNNKLEIMTAKLTTALPLMVSILVLVFLDSVQASPVLDPVEMKKGSTDTNVQDSIFSFFENLATSLLGSDQERTSELRQMLQKCVVQEKLDTCNINANGLPSCVNIGCVMNAAITMRREVTKLVTIIDEHAMHNIITTADSLRTGWHCIYHHIVYSI